MTIDWYQVGTLLVTLVAAGSGGKAWLESRRAKKAGMPADEHTARVTAPAAEWLTDHYRHEVEEMRADMRAELTRERLENDRKDELVELLNKELRAAYDTIADMEQHIWLRKPPPPPLRKT